jgi:hypothetical protein
MTHDTEEFRLPVAVIGRPFLYRLHLPIRFGSTLLASWGDVICAVVTPVISIVQVNKDDDDDSVVVVVVAFVFVGFVSNVVH